MKLPVTDSDVFLSVLKRSHARAYRYDTSVKKQAFSLFESELHKMYHDRLEYVGTFADQRANTYILRR